MHGCYLVSRAIQARASNNFHFHTIGFLLLQGGQWNRHWLSPFSRWAGKPKLAFSFYWVGSETNICFLLLQGGQWNQSVLMFLISSRHFYETYSYNTDFNQFNDLRKRFISQFFRFFKLNQLQCDKSILVLCKTMRGKLPKITIYSLDYIVLVISRTKVYQNW